ncbi:MAG: cell wall hydrolase [Erythrobacter sp.]
MGRRLICPHAYRTAEKQSDPHYIVVMPNEQSNRFRDNAPLFVIAAILLGVFAVLAVNGKVSSPALPDSGPELVVGVEALPASGDDEGAILSALDPNNAKARNAMVPIVEGAPDPAAPFDFRGNGIDRQRARDCLALAAMAEAGSGDADQRAVMQVVLNRVRHPAFAKTVCGVVYEGSQRPTGCQFTFTCDGSLARTYPDSLWRAARERAQEALGGYVHEEVGSATHYHADYVYPTWSDQLDKIAAVGPHLFFRWRGAWGTPKALTARYRGGEPDPAALSNAAQEVDRPDILLPHLTEQGVAVRTITAEDTGRMPAVTREEPAAPGSPAPGVHFVLLSSTDAPAALVDRARSLCPGDRYCQVYGWDDPAAIPVSLPLTDEARRTLRFSYLPARPGNAEVAYFDCRFFPAPTTGSCLPRARQ